MSPYEALVADLEGEVESESRVKLARGGGGKLTRPGNQLGLRSFPRVFPFGHLGTIDSVQWDHDVR